MISNLDKWMRISNEHEKQMEWVENSMLQKICFTRSKTFYDLPCFLISISPRLLIISVSLSVLLCVCVFVQKSKCWALWEFTEIFSRTFSFLLSFGNSSLLKWRLRLLRKKFFAHTKSLAHSTANTRLLIFDIIPPLSLPMYLRVKNSPRRRRSSLGLLFTSSSTIAFRFTVESF